MKKALFVILLVFCVFAIVVAVAEFDPVYVSDFSKDEDGWLMWNSYYELFHTEEGYLKASLIPEEKEKIKSTDPQEIGELGMFLELNDIGVLAGTEYRFSIEIFQNQAKEAKFQFNYSNESAIFYRGTTEIVKKGEWTTLSFTAYVNEGDSSLWLSTSSPYVDYEIRNVRIEPDRKTFIQGIEYDIEVTANDSTMAEFLKLKTGDVLSDEFLDIQIKYVTGEENHELKLHLVPHQAGITRLGGVYWEILPGEDMPEELLGTWEISGKDNGKIYFTFHPDGKVFYNRKVSAGSRAENPKMLQYAYNQGKIMFSLAWPDSIKIDRIDVEDGILIPHALYPQNFPMKGKPKRIADGKASRIKSCSINFYDVYALPDTVFVDPSPDASPYMTYPIKFDTKPDFPVDPSVVFSFSDPEVAEVVDISGLNLYIRGKKPGTTELTVQPDHKKGKASNTITITVLEGEKTLPEELVGVRWVGNIAPSGEPGKFCIIFDQNGRYIYLEKRFYLDYLVVYAGSYLYRDGVIQIGSGNGDGDEGYLAMYFAKLSVDEINGQKIITYPRCSLISEPLSKATDYFPGSVISAIASPAGWDELWAYCRYCWNHQLSLQ